MALHGDNENGVDKMRYSALIYLNDDYEGGELRFENNKIYKLSKNSVIFFQSGIQNRHEVLKITKGLRYTIPLWYQ
jgi:predicted 2-oxoglutarate/Fe(II)-dependent dioxygenase YbiX